jgi:hypothetical protein
MWIEEAQRRIVERMTADERAEFDRGCKIVDFYMAIATVPKMPAATCDEARAKLRAFACRDPNQSVADIDGKATQ